MLTTSRLARGAGVGLLLVATAACGDSADNEKVVDALVEATTQVYQAIDADSTWIISVDEGSEVIGTVTSPGGGELKVVGWRHGAEHATEANYHLVFVERLVLDFNQFLPTNAGITLTGQVIMTRHSLDVGPVDGESITDASRTTVYQGNVIGGGDVSGSFAVDIHGQASGLLTWTCGTVNDEPYRGVGACY